MKLKLEVDDYNKKKNISRNDLRKTLLELNSKFLKKIEPILIEYAESKKIKFLLQKKNIILGSKEYDITNDIILIVNKKINKNDFK
jgi:Skp family chaperone for outer membrane proteins